MKSTLNLALDKKVIEQAKAYAKEKHISLSSLVEQYLSELVAESQPKLKNEASIVDALAGIVNLPTYDDYRKSHTGYLSKKHE